LCLVAQADERHRLAEWLRACGTESRGAFDSGVPKWPTQSTPSSSSVCCLRVVPPTMSE
jgi:hypothetical protein